MNTDQMPKYQPSSASMFVTIAREETHVCGWCLQKGSGALRFVNGRLVLDSHFECMTAGAVDQGKQCSCYERVGDNPKCPIHGSKG